MSELERLWSALAAEIENMEATAARLDDRARKASDETARGVLFGKAGTLRHWAERLRALGA